MSSAVKISGHLNILYFVVKYLAPEGIFSIEHCLIEDMVEKFMTKPLQHSRFEIFRFWALGM